MLGVLSEASGRYPQKYPPFGGSFQQPTVDNAGYVARKNPDRSALIGLPWTLSDEDWRKRVGVEPTKSRLATLSGFEGQPPHRERFPSARNNGGSLEKCHRPSLAAET